MTRTSAPEQQAGSPLDPILLPKEKKLLQKYYAGERLPSPMGGQMDVLGIKSEGGVGHVLLECNTSSLRYLLVIPKATRAEKALVKEALEGGGDPVCPRHGAFHPLTKSGREWSCSLCAVIYGKS